ncbi:probable receptor-like protein kinase At5g61350 [Drosophila madeirensis]|uniref:Probable receptor-like protein kinase At5g61350 n=1 Tax=Drosophila madeirensis TaxID=30013 RepID=A0AAU9G245_DROMD
MPKDRKNICCLCTGRMNRKVTTSCQHSFCKCCLLQQLNHSNRCPLCRKKILFFTSPTCFGSAPNN